MPVYPLHCWFWHQGGNDALDRCHNLLVIKKAPYRVIDKVLTNMQQSMWCTANDCKLEQTQMLLGIWQIVTSLVSYTFL